MISISRALVVVVVIVLLISCATEYGSSGLLTGGGYSDQRIDDSTYRVSFDGNGFAAKDRVWYFWIYRCAELTKQKGFQAFTLSFDAPAKTSFRRSASAMKSAVYHAAGEGRLIKVGSSGYRAPTYIYTPGSTVTTWHSKAVVSMFHLPLLIRMTDVLDAQSILDDLGDYVRSDGKSAAPDRELVVLHAIVRPPPLRNPIKTPPSLFMPPKFQPSSTPSAVSPPSLGKV